MHGVHVSPSEIEKVILEHPEVADCAVVGVRDARRSDGFIPRAWLVLSYSAKVKGANKALKAIEEFARGRLSERQWLQGGFEVIDEVTPFVTHFNSASGLNYTRTEQIPRLPSGRVLRRQLQHAYESRERKKAREQAKL